VEAGYGFYGVRGIIIIEDLILDSRRVLLAVLESVGLVAEFPISRTPLSQPFLSAVFDLLIRILS